jgi:cysteine-rich repeat protein
MRGGRWLLACLCAALSALAPAPGAAQTLDQHHEGGSSPFFLQNGLGAIQTFQPAVSGKLHHIDVLLEPPDPFHFAPGAQLLVILSQTNASGVPASIIGVQQINSSDPLLDDEDGAQFLPIDLSAHDWKLAKNRRYGIELRGFLSGAATTGTHYAWMHGGSYARGDSFARLIDGSLNGPFSTSEAGFKTYMIEEPYCGDGEETPGEQCDDGNESSGDGCSAACVLEYCGDGVTNDVNEQCDDGNTASNDGCSASCVSEYCGDGFVNEVGEQCDDGNTVSDDGCSAACQDESCGDGVQQTSEGCDDANTASGDGCSAACVVESCGDGVTNDVDEQCDDGNTVSDDGCSSTCRTESCGDGIQQPSEQCDDGNTASDDGCSATCHDESCGDGVQQASEGCDDGNTVSNDGCSATCEAEFCGDGVVTGAEWCDDGNTVDDDGCAADCALEPATLACRTALAKSLQKVVTARIGAVQQCELGLAAGKPLSVTDRTACPSEASAAKKIAKAGAKARKAIAGGAKPKCTDGLLAMLGACAETVDGVVSPDGTSGCLLAAGAVSVGEALGTLFPR